MNFLKETNQLKSADDLKGYFPGMIDRIEFCNIHKHEFETIPIGLRNGYPESIDFNKLSGRLMKLIPNMKKIIYEETESFFKKKLLVQYKKIGKKVSNPILNNAYDDFQVNFY